MAKYIKGIAARKPPEPLPDSSAIDEWIPRLSPELQPIVKRVDELIRATIPGLSFGFPRRRPYYGVAKHGWIIEIATYSVSINVLFFGGADFDSPPPLGETDRTRYIKLTSVAEAEDPQLEKWIKQAARTPGWKYPDR